MRTVEAAGQRPGIPTSPKLVSVYCCLFNIKTMYEFREFLIFQIPGFSPVDLFEKLVLSSR